MFFTSFFNIINTLLLYSKNALNNALTDLKNATAEGHGVYGENQPYIVSVGNMGNASFTIECINNEQLIIFMATGGNGVAYLQFVTGGLTTNVPLGNARLTIESVGNYSFKVTGASWFRGIILSHKPFKFKTN